MAMVKATDLSSLRKILRRRGAVAEAQFLAELPLELGTYYRQTPEFSFVPVEDHDRFFAAAARVLFPRDRHRDELLGRAMAEVTYSGVYRLFLSIPTVDYVIERAAAVWGTYYDTGQATVENRQDRRAELVVRDFPDMPAALRHGTTGHVAVLIERTGAERVKVRHKERDPTAWRWIARWG